MHHRFDRRDRRTATASVLVAVVCVVWSLLTPAVAAAGSTTPTVSGPDGRSAFRYSDLTDQAPKYEGGYAAFEDTAAALYATSPHGGYDTASNRCTVCHAVHRAEGSYYVLRGDSQADACEYCHVGSAHSLKVVYDSNLLGTQTRVGHRIGASPAIPLSATSVSTRSTVVTSTDSAGTVTTTTVLVRVVTPANKMFRLQRRHTQDAAGAGRSGYMRVGPVALTCMSCHQPHNAPDELWRPVSFATRSRLASGYMLLRGSPSGSIQGPDDMVYDTSDGTTRTVSYTRDGMQGYRSYTDYGTTGLVNADNVVRAPESDLTSGTYGPGKTIWDSPAWRGSGETLTPTSTVAVDQYALSVWCADCHNLAIGSFEHTSDAPRSGAPSHEASMTHIAPFTGAANGPGQCYTCHRGDLTPQPGTAAYDPSKAACEKCHYGTGSYAVDPVRESAGGADWPHAGSDDGAFLLGAWTVDASGSIVATTVTAANAGQVVCLRCHTAGRPAHSSSGGDPCYVCHAAYRPMDASSTAATSAYHHVLGGAGASGDAAPADLGGYPTSTSTVYCISCHGDHDTFASDKGANLRLSIESTATTNTDFVASAPYGVCVSCHVIAQPKAPQQRSGGSPVTPSISGAAYAQSAHSYASSSTFGASRFVADCSKCHNDGMRTSFQTSQTSFSLHLSAETRLLAAFGLTVPISGQTEEAACYACHSGDTPGPDYYGATLMSANARAVKSAFSAAGSSHPIAVNSGVHTSYEDIRTAPRHVECEDCHDAHAAKPGLPSPGSSAAGGAVLGASAVRLTSWPAVGTDAAGTWTSPSAFAPFTLDGSAGSYEAYLCLKCHSTYTTLPNSVSTGSGTYAPTDVAREFNPNNPSSHNVLGGAGMKNTFTVVDSGGTSRNLTWERPTLDMFQAGYDVSTMLTCTSCHTSGASSARGPHGSSAKWLLDPAYPSEWKTAKLSSASASGMTPGDIICAKCHDLYGTASGASAWGNSVHGSPNHQSAGTCTSCHIKIPHGWKRPRLLGYTTDPAAYATSGLQRVAVTNHTLTGGAPSWAKNDCQSACHSGSYTLSPYWP